MFSAKPIVLFILSLTWSCWSGIGAESGQPVHDFTHPGLLSSKAELDFVKAKIKAGAEPWSSSFRHLKGSKFADPNWVPTPLVIVNARSSDADRELADATAAYTQSLLWYFTDDEAYARKSAAILNAWSAALTRHTSVDRQEQLVAGWCGSIFPLAAEILRASYPRWPKDKIAQFSTMLDRAFLPLLVNGNPTYNGNWELTMINGLVCIGVFNDDRASFERGLVLWRKRVPAYFYLTTDGPSPIRPHGTADLDSAGAIDAYWFHPQSYFTGLCQETLRDSGHHMQEGLVSAVNAAEIAYHQGVDLYAENGARIIAAMEFQAGPLLGRPVSAELFPNGFAAAEWLPTWEIAYNHFHNRRGLPLPATRALIDAMRRSPEFYATHNNMVWECVTHADLVPAAKR